MHRFFHECYSDPALGAVMAVAFILVLTMACFILKEKLQKRNKLQLWERRRRELKQRAGKSDASSRRQG